MAAITSNISFDQRKMQMLPCELRVGVQKVVSARAGIETFAPLSNSPQG